MKLALLASITQSPRLCTNQWRDFAEKGKIICIKGNMLNAGKNIFYYRRRSSFRHIQYLFEQKINIALL